ncbi:GNAT family N-acetyltransferase [Dactylosporangium sp. CA-139066]|uniref:GNAT family N-acetyltransferase n=1 Tax=Dactylosporangium sp. CA-139066 TaxID=3239930 RepID=UPI003D8B59D2
MPPRTLCARDDRLRATVRSVAAHRPDCDDANVTTDPLLERARQLWADLAGAPVTFMETAITVATSPQSWLCPPGWVGIVALGQAVIATAPDDETAELVRQALSDLPASAMIDAAAVRGRLPVQDELGPATLAYCDAAAFRLLEAGTAEVGSPALNGPAVDGVALDPGKVEAIPADHADMSALLARVPADDADEAALSDITSAAFVLRAGGDVVAAAGYRAWPRDTAHVSVLLTPAVRGRGLARIVAGAAVAHALDAGLFPQWRARPEASRRVARALGFRELGSQLSIDLRPANR